MMKKITFLFILLTVSLGYSQQVVLQDFESGGLGATFGGLSASVVADPEVSGTRGMVAELVASASGNVWQGTNINIDENVLLTTDKTMSIDVYSTSALSIAVKVTGSTDGGPDSTTSINHTGTGWETIIATFNTSQDGTGVANGTYTNFVVYTNWDPNTNTFINPAVDRTVYVDNITGTPVAVVPDPEPSEAAPTPPARAAADVKSIFSDAYTPIATLNYAGVDGQPSNDNTYNTSWCPGTTELVQIAGNNTNKVTGLGCEGVSFLSARFDATSFTHFHIDIWTDTATQDKSFNIKFSNWDGGAAEVNAIEFSTTNASNPALPNPNPGTWISLDIPLTDWSAGNRNDLVQFIITSDLGAVYYDNLYLHKNTTLGTEDFAKTSFKTYPNPTQDNWTIETQNVRMSSITVYDVLGKSVMAIEPNEDRAVIDGSNLKSGLYFAKVETAEGVSSVKLVKK